MNKRFAAASAALLCLTASEASYAATNEDVGCWRAEEARAARLQTLQNYLMIDAIKCQDTIPTTLASYNDFVNRRRDMITTNKRTVQAHFVRLRGSVDGVNASTDYETRLGNRLSASGIDVKRCETAGLYARLAANAGDDDLVAMAAMLAGDADMIECPVAAPPPPRPTAMVIPVWKKPAPPVAVSAPPIATAETAFAVKPAVVAAAAPVPVVAAPAPRDPEKERRDALAALQLAAAALSQAALALGPNAPLAAAKAD